MSKTFNVAGFSSKAGKVSFRVANGTAAARAKVLAKDGHENIDLIDLPSPMSKEDAEVFARKALNFSASTATAKPKAEKVAGIKVKPAKETFKVTKTAKEVKEMIAPKPELTEEQKAVKEKNLQTMQAVSERLSKMRDYD